MEKLPKVNGHQIKLMSREEIDKELKANGDWGIEYLVPGRRLNGYYITVNRKRYRFNTLEEVEKVCNAYSKKELQGMSESEVKSCLMSASW